MEKALERFIKRMKPVDRYLLDDKNAIIVVENKNQDDTKNRYCYMHLRLVGRKVIEVSRWYISIYYFGSIHGLTVIKSHNLFLVQNNIGGFDSAYDYVQGKFIIPKGMWHKIYRQNGNCDYLEKYGCLIGERSISSEVSEGDHYVYFNPLTSREETLFYYSNDGTYFAMLDPDGTIRRNRLFKGNRLSEIIKVVNLDDFGSLDEFVASRVAHCNACKRDAIEEDKKRIASRNNGSNSPYEDAEVLKTLEMKPIEND